MKKILERKDFIKFTHLTSYIESEVIGLNLGDYPNTEFDQTKWGDLIFNLKLMFHWLNHMNSHSYTGMYHGSTGFLHINKIKTVPNSELKIVINENNDIEFLVVKRNTYKLNLYKS
jgi:hypothetical protein